MFLTLYHDDRKPYTVYNVIKVAIDNERTIIVTIKHGSYIEYVTYRYQTAYQRFVVALD